VETRKSQSQSGRGFYRILVGVKLMRDKQFSDVMLFLYLLLFLFNNGFADENSRSILFSVMPGIDIPLTRDANLFRPSSGVSAAGSYAIPSALYFSVGGKTGYHLGRLEHEDINTLGTMSLLSAEALAQWRFSVRHVDIRLSGGAGQFYAFMNNEPSSSAANLVWHGRIGIELKRTSDKTIGVQAEYRHYHKLYHFLAIGLYFEFWQLIL
jgi:hypothetical protein